MKEKQIKELAMKTQEKLITEVCTEYYEKEGEITDATVDVLNRMLDNLEATDRDTVMSAIVFSELYAKANFNEPEQGIKYTKAKKD